MTGLPARCKLSIKPRWPRQGCIKLSILSPRGTSGERTEERGNQQKRTSSPQPSPPSDGGEGEIQEIDAARARRQSRRSFRIDSKNFPTRQGITAFVRST